MTAKQKIMTKNAVLGMTTILVTGLVIGAFNKMTGIDNLFERVIESGLYLIGASGAVYFGVIKMKKDVSKL